MALAARWDPTNQTTIAPDTQCDPDFKQFAVNILTQGTSIWRIITDEVKGQQNLQVSLSSLMTSDALRYVDEETLLHVFNPMMKVHAPTFQVVIAWMWPFPWRYSGSVAASIGTGNRPVCSISCQGGSSHY